MKTAFIIPIIATLALGTGSAFAQPAAGNGTRQKPASQQMDQRFQHMNSMIQEAGSAHGPQRMKLMQEHMQLMQEQMQAMQSMMGPGMMMGQGMGGGYMGGGHMGQGMMGNGTTQGAPAYNEEMLKRMQTRMDYMQQMMQQMLDQQNLMMQPQGK